MTTKTVFNLVYWPIFLIINGVYFFLLWKRMVPQVVRDWYEIIFALFNLGLVFVASQICRALGFSRREETLEIYHRVTTRHVDSVECVEYKTMAKWQIWLCLLLFFAATTGSGFLAFISFGGKPSDFWTGIAGVAVFGTMLVIK